MSVCCHDWNACDHPGYVVCRFCGTFKSTEAPAPEEVYTADYWSHDRGHSTLEEQVYNCESHLECGVSKNQFVLDRIAVEDRSAALEIGCSPGALLRKLAEGRHFDVVEGVDVLTLSDECWSGDGWAVNNVTFGLFPPATKSMGGDRYSLIVGCDVFEHSHEPWPFLLECSRLLKKDGQLILMLPLVIPGEEVPERMFHPTEHVYIHSQGNLTALLEQAGFDRIEYSRWCPGHEVVSARKGEMPERKLRAG